MKLPELARADLDPASSDRLLRLARAEFLDAASSSKRSRPRQWLQNLESGAMLGLGVLYLLWALNFVAMMSRVNHTTQQRWETEQAWLLLPTARGGPLWARR